MNQWFNKSAIKNFALSVFSMRSQGYNQYMPQLHVPDISILNYAKLQEHFGITHVLFDKEATLTTPGVNTHFWSEEVEDSVDECLDCFGKNNVAILSNYAGGVDDKFKEYTIGKPTLNNYKKLPKKFFQKNKLETERHLGLKVISHPKTQKPNCVQEVLNHFGIKDKKQLENFCIIGDRRMTDIVMGNQT